MGAESRGAQVQLPLCPNCRKRRGGTSSSRWPHIPVGVYVCRPACGIRLNHRIASGMLPQPSLIGHEYWPAAMPRTAELRLRIKVLNARLRAARRPAAPAGAP